MWKGLWEVKGICLFGWVSECRSGGLDIELFNVLVSRGGDGSIGVG